MIRAAAAVVALVVLVGCASDEADEPDQPAIEEAADGTEAPTTAEEEPTVDDDVAADPSNDDGSTGDAADDEQVKPDPARDAGPVEGPPGTRPDGFTTATVRVTGDDGESCDVCLWLADDAEERSRGLMGVTDLGEPVGMLFRFDGSTSGNFFMFGTPMPLSIAWFDAAGAHVSETDMAPCVVNDSSECQRYGPGAEYVSAIEMVQGELGVIGIGPGSTIEILEEHETCPVAG